MNTTTLSVKNLLIESRIHNNLETEIDRFKHLSDLLREYKSHKQSLETLTESESLDMSNLIFEECAKVFAESKKALKKAKSSDHVGTIHEALKAANAALNELEGLVVDIEDVLEEALNDLEKSDGLKKN